MQNDINERLAQVYSRYHQELINSVPEQERARVNGPFYAWVPPCYALAQRKLLFIGQQVTTWYGIQPENALAMSVADIQSKCQQMVEKDVCTMKSPFWSFTKNVSDNFYSSGQVCIAYTNYQKLSFDCKKYWSSDEKMKRFIECKFKKILKEELNILNPNVIIAYLGDPDKQYFLSKILDEHKPQRLKTSIPLWKAKVEVGSKQAILFRTYHPRYLRQQKLEQGVIQLILTDLSTYSQ